MPAISRYGVDKSAGHCFPARPSDSTPNGTVYINGILANVIGAHYPTHCCSTVCHDSYACVGSPNVFFESAAVHRIGDAETCGDIQAQGSPNVFAN